MKKIKVVGLSLVSVLALSSFASASADASRVMNGSRFKTEASSQIDNCESSDSARESSESRGKKIKSKNKSKKFRFSRSEAAKRDKHGWKYRNSWKHRYDAPIISESEEDLKESDVVEVDVPVNTNEEVKENENPATPVVIEEAEPTEEAAPVEENTQAEEVVPAENITTESPEAALGQAIIMTATAYDDSAEANDGWAGITATGTKLRPGVVAVDPNVIPLGTELYVEYEDGTPYGYVVAEDIGTSIKGNKIDIFMDSSLVWDFGIKTMKVYVVEK